MILRQFNNNGIKRFREELEKYRKDSLSPIDFHMLEDNALTENVPGGGNITAQIFKTKGDAGSHIHSLLKSTALTPNEIASNTELWSWLSLFFFDSLCPQNPQGRRKVNDVHFYIYDQRWNYYYRHLLFVSWKVWDMTQGNHRLITSTKIHEIDRVTRFIMNDLTMIRIPCIFKVLDHVYWNANAQKTRKNITGTGSNIRKGDISRFKRVIRQLEKTYDLQSLNAKELIELLGDEFDFTTW